MNGVIDVIGEKGVTPADVYSGAVSVAVGVTPRHTLSTASKQKTV